MNTQTPAFEHRPAALRRRYDHGHLEKIESYIAIGQQEGGQLATGG